MGRLRARSETGFPVGRLDLALCNLPPKLGHQAKLTLCIFNSLEDRKTTSQTWIRVAQSPSFMVRPHVELGYGVALDKAKHA